MNKDTMLMVSVAVALLAIFLLYRDMQKTKLDLQNLTDEHAAAASAVKVVHKKVPLSSPPLPPAAAIVVADEED